MMKRPPTGNFIPQLQIEMIDHNQPILLSTIYGFIKPTRALLPIWKLILGSFFCFVLFYFIPVPVVSTDPPELHQGNAVNTPRLTTTEILYHGGAFTHQTTRTIIFQPPSESRLLDYGTAIAEECAPKESCHHRQWFGGHWRPLGPQSDSPRCLRVRGFRSFGGSCEYRRVQEG